MMQRDPFPLSLVATLSLFYFPIAYKIKDIFRLTQFIGETFHYQYTVFILIGDDGVHSDYWLDRESRSKSWIET